MLLVIMPVLLALISGCKEKEKEILLPEINFQAPELEIDPDGGDYSIGYTVANISYDVIPELSKDVDWITNLSSTETVISFRAGANPSFDEERRGNIVISCQGASDTLEVIQRMSEISAENMKIDITVNSVTSISINATFEPSNEDSTYCVMAVAKTEFSEYSDDEAFISEQVEQFTSAAVSSGLTLEEYLAYYVLRSGKLTKDMVGLEPQTEYYVVAFEISPLGTPGKRLFKAEAVTGESGSGNVDVSFELDAEVNGKIATFEIVPSDDAVRYYQSYISVEYLEYLQKDLKESIEYIIEQEIYYSTEVGISLSEVIESLSYWGPVTYSAELYSTSRHILFAVAIDELGNLVSDVDSLSFAMEKVTSDNNITLTMGKIGVDNAEVNVTTTNDDSYIIGVARSVDWSGFTDEQIATAVLYRGSDIYNGDNDFVFRYLTAGTDYVVAAVGYDGVNFTTDVAKAYFTTESVGDMEDMEFEFTIEDITPFGATISVSATPVTNLYYWYYKYSWMTEEDVKNDIDMIIQNYMAMGIISSRLQYFQYSGSRGYDSMVLRSMTPDTEYRAFAIGIDETNGNYATPVFFSEPFRTKVREEVDVVVEAYVKDYYDVDALVSAGYGEYAAYSGYAVANLAAKVSGSVECKDYYFHMATLDMTDASEYTDDYIIELLLDNGFHNVDAVQVYVPFDRECTLIAVGVDGNGNPGQVYRNKVTLTREGAWDVDSFVPDWGQSNLSSVMDRNLKEYTADPSLVLAL